MAAMKTLAAACAALALAGCAFFGPARDPVPTVLVPGAEPGRVLVVVLPGFADDADDLQEQGVAAAIHRGWPAPDVMLVGATFNYYRTGQLVPQLEKNVIGPARQRGYRDIWLAGGSMGGMGVLLYEQVHPGEVTGLLLMSPFLGTDAVLDEIREAGLAQWDPGPLAPTMDGSNYERHVWNMIKGWRATPGRARRAWLVCGTEDRLFRDVQLLAPEIPPEQFLVKPGGHDWDYWIPAIEDTFRRIAATQAR
jgi:pimeloyl-ACP methyl ester carboxylesterase